MRKQKVYESEAEILTLIDGNNFLLDRTPIMIEEAEKELKQLGAWLDENRGKSAKESEKETYHKRWNRMVDLSEDLTKLQSKLRRCQLKAQTLKEKLAAMRTEIMTFMEGYVGVV